jgi:hypothetical protein
MAKISKRRGIYNLEKILKNRGIDPDLVDLDALYDDTLTYGENKENILKQIHLSEDVQDERSYLVEAVGNVMDQRSGTAIDADTAKRASKTYKIDHIAGVNDWLENPNRVDIEGIDAFASSKPTKAKVKKKKKRR